MCRKNNNKKTFAQIYSEETAKKKGSTFMPKIPNMEETRKTIDQLKKELTNN